MDWNTLPLAKDPPDFQNILTVLQRGIPRRPTLFEFFLNDSIYSRVVPELWGRALDSDGWLQLMVIAFTRLGYDFTNLQLPDFSLIPPVSRRMDKSVSLNEGGLPHQRADIETYDWPDPQAGDYGLLDRVQEILPPGMKLVLFGPGGLLENAISLLGFDQLCYLIHDDPQLADELFERIGARMVSYYRRVSRYDSVGACLANDDWGFKTGTMLSPRDMRRFVFPWYRQVVEAVHAAGKPVFLHSCGYFEKIIDDIVEDMKFDGRHSYEDTILPVEEAYERYHDRLAIIGGIDVDFLCRSTPEAIYERSRAMLERSAGRGGYALGSGNSIPYYVPDQSYFAMTRAGLDLR